MILTLSCRCSPWPHVAARWRNACWAWPGLLIGGMAIFLTLSRGGWLGAGVGVAFTVAAAPGSRYGSASASRAASALVVFVAAGGVHADSAGGGRWVRWRWRSFGTLAFVANSSTRPGWLFRSSLSPREDAWRAGGDMFLDHPLIGAGPNSFGLLYPEYSARQVRGAHAARPQRLPATRRRRGAARPRRARGAGSGGGLHAVATWRTVTSSSGCWPWPAPARCWGSRHTTRSTRATSGRRPAVALAFVGAIIARNYAEGNRRRRCRCSRSIVRQ